MFASSYSNTQKTRRIFLIVSAGLLLVTATLGVKMNMMMDGGDMAMAGCPFMETGSLCQMTVAEHLRVWESLLTAVTHPEFFLALLLIVIATGFFFLISTGPPLFVVAAEQYRRRPDTALFRPLLLAFSDGIIHPKLYS
ncbi:hypothetical protein A3H75_00235 [Candidatus Uhrbacteria bacterium RIFCSPLOWO2_02_FULL_51_9]|uniref:Uncharacterized protein n=1 Tax=Candidatus Uhrbacteria bacterium RIFCSPLOWO2_02_FULL_51_9 TaxID=1802410 RepID=A0A1F7VDT0_9BACT|nr:MAG: hypothetical protein A3H75_00235 [Candidatus Uhrbacteria bacterium RIFCSPLOWO2_02_FULL_51_9]